MISVIHKSHILSLLLKTSVNKKEPQPSVFNRLKINYSRIDPSRLVFLNVVVSSSSEEAVPFWTIDDNFLDTIWEMSLTAFDIPREVQVVVDGKMNIHISAGDPGFVWFKEPPMGMTLPIECWIHTHPFGKAYFSGTDCYVGSPSWQRFIS